MIACHGSCLMMLSVFSHQYIWSDSDPCGLCAGDCGPLPAGQEQRGWRCHRGCVAPHLILLSRRRAAAGLCGGVRECILIYYIAFC